MVVQSVYGGGLESGCVTGECKDWDRTGTAKHDRASDRQSIDRLFLVAQR